MAKAIFPLSVAIPSIQWESPQFQLNFISLGSKEPFCMKFVVWKGWVQSLPTWPKVWPEERVLPLWYCWWPEVNFSPVLTWSPFWLPRQTFEEFWEANLTSYRWLLILFYSVHFPMLFWRTVGKAEVKDQAHYLLLVPSNSPIFMR